MTINEYQRLAMTTLNKELTDREILMNGVMGLCGESGEAIDIVKKHVFQGHELNREHLLEEIGDVAWYLAELATVLDVDLEEVLANNIEKLKARYPEGFESVRSINRIKEENFNMKTELEYPEYPLGVVETYFDDLDEEFRRQVGMQNQ